MAWDSLQPPSSSNIVSIPTVIDKPVVQILLPHRDDIRMEVVESMWKPLTMVPAPWFNKTISMCRVPSLPNARNTLVQEWLKSDAEYGLWLDSDHVVETPTVKVQATDGSDMEVGDPNTAIHQLMRALEETGESIATGLYRAKQKHGFNYAIWKQGTQPDGKKGFVHINDWNPPEANWFEVDVAGMGFMLMHRRVPEAMRDAGYGTNENPFFHWEMPGEMSEDFDFLMKARGLGYKTWCLTTVRLTHFGSLAIETNGSVRVPRV